MFSKAFRTIVVRTEPPVREVAHTISRKKVEGCMNLTSHLSLLPSLRMSWGVLLLSLKCIFSFCGKTTCVFFGAPPKHLGHFLKVVYCTSIWQNEGPMANVCLCTGWINELLWNRDHKSSCIVLPCVSHGKTESVTTWK